MRKKLLLPHDIPSNRPSRLESHRIAESVGMYIAGERHTLRAPTRTCCPRLFLLNFLFSVFNLRLDGWVTGVCGWRTDGQTERDGREEQNITILSEDLQNNDEGKAYLVVLSSSFSFCCLFFSSFVEWVWVWEGLGRQIYPWDRARFAF
jgi:hypothetical protein